jgi:hypothetical protein
MSGVAEAVPSSINDVEAVPSSINDVEAVPSSINDVEAVPSSINDVEAVPSSINDKVMSGVGRWVPVVLGAILVWPAIPLLELAVGSAILVRPALLMTPMRSLAAVVQVVRRYAGRWIPAGAPQGGLRAVTQSR